MPNDSKTPIDPQSDEFSFLKSPDGYEASITSTRIPITPYIFQLDQNQDAHTIAEGLKSLNPDVICEPYGTSAISVILPPDIKIGDTPVDLREIALTISTATTVKKLGLQNTYEFCCGNGRKGCCVNLI